MAANESLSTMQQNSYTKNADGDYSLKVQSAPTVGAQATSNWNSQSQAAPAPGTIIANVNIGLGLWDIEATAFIIGTTVAALESDNIEFRIGAGPVAKVIVPVNGTSGATANGVFHGRISVGGTTNVSLNATAQATAGSTYKGTIVATRVA